MLANPFFGFVGYVPVCATPAACVGLIDECRGFPRVASFKPGVARVPEVGVEGLAGSVLSIPQCCAYSTHQTTGSPHPRGLNPSVYATFILFGLIGFVGCPG